jgi:methylated-DNA-protein-cysteine methyltransferase related protein
MTQHMNFKERAFKVIKKIPYGRVTTYGTIATLAGLPRGARLVGGLLHFTSEQENLPWQRIINRHGFISTKCLEHPKELQKTLLEQEGIEVSSEFMVDLKKYGWFGDF